MTTHTYRCHVCKGEWQHTHDGPGAALPQSCPNCRTGHRLFPIGYPPDDIPEWMKPGPPPRTIRPL